MKTIVNHTKERRQELFNRFKPQAQQAGLTTQQLYERLSRGVAEDDLLKPALTAQERVQQHIERARQGVTRCNDPEGISHTINQAWKPPR